MTSSHPEGIAGIASRVRNGDRRTLSRALTLIENQVPAGRELLHLLYTPDPPAHRIGITGPPGSGKSTLVNELTSKLRSREEEVGILAVDPSSPYSGGAILGDRIRMHSLYGDDGVFIRSMASRGSLGGLASTTQEATELLEAAGYPWILVETVGVGQSEMEIVEIADTTILVLVPESGDAVQVMKAGLMEAGDVFVVNKYDREGGDRLVKEISLMLEIGQRPPSEGNGPLAGAVWSPPICQTVASRGEGVDSLVEAVMAHREFLRADPVRTETRRENRLIHRMRVQLRDRILNELTKREDLDLRIREGVGEIRAGEASPYAWIEQFIDRLLSRGSETVCRDEE